MVENPGLGLSKVGVFLLRRAAMGLLKQILPTSLSLLWALTSTSVGWGEKHKDDMGRWVEIRGTPQRVVTLAPSLAEIMFDLGLGETLVGVTEYTNYPPQAALKPKVGSYVHLQLEAIVGLRPDLILATREGNPRHQIEQLERLGLKVFVTDPRSIEGLFNTILSIGEVFGRVYQANELVRNMSSRMEAIKRVTSSRPRPRVLLQVGSRPLIVAGSNTVQDHLIQIAGGENVAAPQGRGYPVLSLEKVIALRPEVILISSMADKDGAEREKEEWLRWHDLPAVKTHRIHVLEGDLIDRPSPRIVQGLASMAKAIHPDISDLVDTILEPK